MPDEKFAALEARLDRIEAAWFQRFPPVDPSPDDIGRWGSWGGWRPIPIGDPVPIDISRLSKAQLQISLEAIKAQRIRLDAIENMVQTQLKQMR